MTPPPALRRRRRRRHHGRRRRRPGRHRGRRHHRRRGAAARRPRGQAERDPRHVAARRQRAARTSASARRSSRRPSAPARSTTCSPSRPPRACAWRPRVVPGGVAIVNTQQIVPPLASQGEYSYPFDAVERMDDGSRRVTVVDGNAVAAEGRRRQGRRRRARGRAVDAPALRPPRRGSEAIAAQRAGELARDEPVGVRRGGPARRAAREGHGPYAGRPAPGPRLLRPRERDARARRPAGAPARASPARRRRSPASAAPCTGRCAGRRASSRPTSSRSTTSAASRSSRSRRCATPIPAGLRLCGLDEIIEVHSTSGTTGKPTPIWVTRRDMDAWAQRNARSAVDGRPAPRRPPAELLRLRAPDEHRPAVRRAARRHRRRAGRHRPSGAAHRPHRRPRRDRHLHDAVLRALPRRQGEGARHRPGHRVAAAHRPLRRRALARVGPRPPLRRPRRRRLQRVRHGRVPGTGHGVRVPGQGRHARVVGPPAGGVHRPGDLRAGRRRRTGRARVDLADQRLHGDDPLPQPRHQLAELGALRLRPHASQDRPHHRAQRRRPVHRRPRRVPQPDRGSAACASTRWPTTSAWSSSNVDNLDRLTLQVEVRGLRRAQRRGAREALPCAWSPASSRRSASRRAWSSPSRSRCRDDRAGRARRPATGWTTVAPAEPPGGGGAGCARPTVSRAPGRPRRRARASQRTTLGAGFRAAGPAPRRRSPPGSASRARRPR